MHVAPSITTTGRSCISASGLLLEAFLSNNVKFGSLDDMITFIDNIVHNEERHYADKDFLDGDISREEVMAKLFYTCGFDYIPTEEDAIIIWDILGTVSQEDLNRIYYKNNLFEFMSNSSMIKAIEYLLNKLDSPLINPNYSDKNEPMKSIKVELDEFRGLLKEYVYYPHQIIDRLDRYNLLPRKSCILTDTDSVICSFDGWYRFIMSKISNKVDSFKISHELVPLFKQIKYDKYGYYDESELTPLFELSDDDYDFYNDERIEIDKAMNPDKIIPQEGVKNSIINILAYCLTDILNDYILKYTINSNSYEEGKKCLLYLKNEFLFKRILLEEVKKHYASIIKLQEGHVVPQNRNAMDIKGLELNKSTANDTTSERLKSILYEDVLYPDNIDQVKVLKDLAKFEKEIYYSLISGKKDFYTPKRIKSMHSYKDPLRTAGIKPSIVWNTIRDKDMPLINLEEMNSIDVVKVDINPKNVYKLKDENEEAYNKIIKLMEEKGFDKINSIAVPLDGEIPKYLIQYIDYNTVINDNLSLFPVESIGIGKFNKSNNYTNIIHI